MTWKRVRITGPYEGNPLFTGGFPHTKAISGDINTDTYTDMNLVYMHELETTVILNQFQKAYAMVI